MIASPSNYATPADLIDTGPSPKPAQALSEPVIWVGLPAYNEEIAIGSLLKRFHDYFSDRPERPYRIVVYNDGSKDNTVAVADSWRDRLNLDVIGHENNKGLGEGISRLVEYVVRHGQPHDYCVIMDCDDTHSPQQIDQMMEAHLRGYDLVIASRYRRGASIRGVPRHRVVLSCGAAILFKVLHPMRGLRDYTCGFRSYRVGLLQAAHRLYSTNLVREQGFACMVELLLRLKRFRPKVIEVPLSLRYDLKPTASKMDVGGNTWQLLKLLWVWRLNGI
jgi:dolichol-phosphate mannosyltransferase